VRAILDLKKKKEREVIPVLFHGSVCVFGSVPAGRGCWRVLCSAVRVCVVYCSRVRVCVCLCCVCVVVAAVLLFGAAVVFLCAGL